MTYIAEVVYLLAFLVFIIFLGVVAWCLLEVSDFFGRTAARRRLRREREHRRVLREAHVRTVGRQRW